MLRELLSIFNICFKNVQDLSERLRAFGTVLRQCGLRPVPVMTVGGFIS